MLPVKISFELTYHKWRRESYCHKMTQRISFVRQCLCTAAAAMNCFNLLQHCDYLIHMSISEVRESNSVIKPFTIRAAVSVS